MNQKEANRLWEMREQLEHKEFLEKYGLTEAEWQKKRKEYESVIPAHESGLMIKISNNLWIGNSDDERHGDLDNRGITAVLNVAYDMDTTRSWQDDIETAKVGLIDGPGNHLSTYCAAIITLASLLRRRTVLVCCHTGGRSAAVVIMYLALTNRLDWDGIIELLAEKGVNMGQFPLPDQSHYQAFNKLDWNLLEKVIRHEKDNRRHPA